MTVRLAYLVTHPIQYQAPLLRRVAADPDIELKVFFGSDFSAHAFVDRDFGQAIEWDVPLLEGYEHEVLPTLGRRMQPGESPSCWRPLNRGLGARLRDFDALWVHGYNRATHWAAMAAAKRLGLAVLLRDEATLVSAPRSLPKRLAKRLFFTALDRAVDAYLTIGSLNHAYYRAHGVAETKLVAMPYAVDNQWFRSRIALAAPRREHLRLDLGLHSGRPVVLFAGKLIPRKRPMDLVAALRHLAPPLPYVLFAGDGELRPLIEQEAARHGLDGVRVLGFQSQAELAALYDLCDLFVLPSERESWGLVVNEVLNAGRPVVVNDRIGAAADLVRGGETGFLYPCGDVEALAACLRTLLADPARAQQMGAAGRRLIETWSFDQDLAGLKTALAATARVRARVPA